MKIFNIIKKLFNYKNKKEKNVCSFSTTKHSIGSSYTLKFSTETEKKKQEINEKLKKLIIKYINSPEKLMQTMKLKGMKVYKIRNAGKILEKLKEEEGFLTPLKGYKAFVINLLIGILYENKLKLSLKTKEMFIFNAGETEIYTIARALHKYYGFKNNLPGFDYKSQEIFKKVYSNSKTGKVLPFADCSKIKDIYACKEALSRDLESINFTIELSVEHERAKKALNLIKNTKSANI